MRSAALMGAIAAIDIALWDIAGKRHDVPVHELIGGMARDRARVYRHVIAKTRADQLAGIKQAPADGYTAVGHLSPMPDGQRTRPEETHSYVQKLRAAIDTVGLFRAAAGDRVDLCIEIHRRLKPPEAITLAHEIEPFQPMFYEDPIGPDNFDSMAYVASRINLPIATGERFTTPREFAMLLRRDAARYVRPNVCLVGGITGAMKIAALAEAHDVEVVPHNPLSPVSTAACLQVAAAITNLGILEYCGDEHQPPKASMVLFPARLDGQGYLLVPTEPGIGVTLNRDALDLVQPYQRGFITRLHYDGSVVND
ncbi:mandelate racemase/muconate lactonizing enzyme family protein [Flindersiella endophytica]